MLTYGIVFTVSSQLDKYLPEHLGVGFALKSFSGFVKIVAKCLVLISQPQSSAAFCLSWCLLNYM